MLKSKPYFLIRQKWGNDMNYPSVCCEYFLLSLVKKKKQADLPTSQTKQIYMGITSRETESKKVKSRSPQQPQWKQDVM